MSYGTHQIITYIFHSKFLSHVNLLPSYFENVLKSCLHRVSLQTIHLQMDVDTVLMGRDVETTAISNSRRALTFLFCREERVRKEISNILECFGKSIQQLKCIVLWLHVVTPGAFLKFLSSGES
ncbi:hypothetical protein NPIL_132671 [Nephila pilipes]|uniref:Uncharacterized protein n=1 Tax=Nephila pilipes TaxID=299642 RepID=A0A8X6P615_NEPPI|nr:hypothetical protein NPIL_132671 [Nephila pilipes]